jgi:DNA polymerase-3 subunit epsilon
VQVAPVQGASAEVAGGVAANGISGFVLTLDNITRRIETGNRRDFLLQTLTQGTRASLASMRAAIETIASFPEMDRASRDRFIAVIGEEAQRLSGKLDETVGEFADSMRTEWPLEDMRGPDRRGAAQDRKQARAADQERDRRRVDLAQRR